ncbi:MAG TPA: PQQ-binding-like beta-propeller repeat protein [Blastocatellia bacterium]|nr:PQQ-binding-like beta-propeller repeat protein [Blastocatellia bacterium]
MKRTNRFSGAGQHRALKLMLATLFVSGSLLIVPTKMLSAAQQSGIYTEAQAARGQALYDARCASCHGLQLEGGSASPLAGSRFMAKWGRGDKSVDDLYFITRTQMPYGAGNTLTPQEYIDIVAYMLRASGWSAGTVELAADSAQLKQIRIVPQGSGKEGAVRTQAGGAATASVSGSSAPSSNLPMQSELTAAQTNTTDWLMSNHDYSGQRFVDLKQINEQNVAALRPVCLYQAGDTKAFHNNPVVYRGVMYITTSLSTIALDATSCRVKWRHDWKPKSIEVWPPNRGVAISGGRVVRATTDGFMYALDLETGKMLWQKKVVAAEKNEGSFNMAPLIYEDLILLGLGISEQGVRGWIGAFRLESGEPVWRFNTVPDEGEPGAETWGKPDAKLHGGGAVWAPLSLDPQAGLLYVPVANPAPDFHDDIRPGANLYTNSMVVLDVRTGKLKWYYQTMPHDTHDWDLTQVSPLFTTTVAGKQRRLVALVGKDGLLHVLDRESKEHLYETPVTTRLNADVPVPVSGIRACPGVLGGVLWNGPAFNPGTNMLYVPAVDWCGTFRKAEEARFVQGQTYMGGSYIADPPTKSRGWLTAIDASTGKVAWRYESSRPMLAAVTTTSSDLIFTGELTGDFLALDARTGKVLYRFNTGGPMNGGVVSYAINGKQYVAVASGSASGFWQAAPGSSTIVVFSLPQSGRMTP